MPSEPQEAGRSRPQYRGWLQGTFVFLALLVIARFVLEVAGVPPTVARYLSSSVVVLLAAIYLGAIAPLRGVAKSLQLVPPGIALAVWEQAWVILFTLVSGGLRLTRSHFAVPEDYGNWPHLWGHAVEHIKDIGPSSLVILVLMATTFVLWRWPVTVGPGAVLGALVILRYSAEAMGFAPTTAAAWSSTVGTLLAACYLGGIGAYLGLTSFKQFLAPSLVLGWTWRFWIFVAALMSAAAPYYKTHFFDPSKGHLASRLLRFFAGEVVVVGFVAGLLVWGIAVWVSRAIRPLARQEG